MPSPGPLTISKADAVALRGSKLRCAPPVPSGGQSRAFDAVARSCKRYRIDFDDGHTTILAAHELLTVSRPISRAERSQFCAHGSIQLLVSLAALPCRVLGGRRRGPTASVLASEADREDRGSCCSYPTGQAQRSGYGHGLWAKASTGDHEVEERYAQVRRRLCAVLVGLLLQTMLRLPSVA